LVAALLWSQTVVFSYYGDVKAGNLLIKTWEVSEYLPALSNHLNPTGFEMDLLKRPKLLYERQLIAETT
jgi:hypothetical protein